MTLLHFKQSVPTDDLSIAESIKWYFSLVFTSESFTSFLL